MEKGSAVKDNSNRYDSCRDNIYFLSYKGF